MSNNLELLVRARVVGCLQILQNNMRWSAEALREINQQHADELSGASDMITDLISGLEDEIGVTIPSTERELVP